MEETQEKQVNLKGKSLERQLKQVDELQKEVKYMSYHIAYLLKEESRQQKKMQNIYRNSIKMTNNKINHVSTHICQKERIQHEYSERMQRHGSIKEMRQKGIQELRQTRIEVSNIKQNQTKKVREISKINDKIIRLSKEALQENNVSRATLMKQKNQERKQKIKAEQEKIKREKQETAFQEKMSIINQGPQLKKKFEELKKKSDQIEGRIQKKHQLKAQIKQTAHKISKLDDAEIINLAEICKNKAHNSRIHSESVQQSENKKETLFMTALKQDICRIR